jgi:predicted metalloprotease with PDZ domain
MRRVLLTTVIAVCAISVYPSHPRPTVVLNYAFEPLANDGKLVMRILLEFQSRPMETADLVVPTAWGDAKDLEKGITNLKNVHDAGSVRISYDLVRDWVVAPPRADHHAILEPEYFEFNTQNGLVHPKIASTAPVEVHFDWRKLPPSWSLATSFGTGDRLQSFSGTWGEVNNALFAGGDFRIQQTDIAGRPLILAIRSKWQITDEQVAVRILKMISFERAFWRDYNFPYYLVTVSTFGRDDGGSGGGGFTNAFALFLQRGSSFGYGVQSLLAHEIFHTWNPYRMGVLPDSSIAMSWFTEGFTTYYQDVLLLRAGLLSFPEYVQHTNENLRKYLLSPASNVTNREVIERHRVDSASDVIPYSRGATTALWLDSTIRKATRGKSSLDTVMFDLVRQARRRRPVLTAERVFRTAGKYIDAASLQQLREYAELGKTITVPPAALGPCATLQMDDIPTFELGMDREELVGQHKVSGVKAGSAAFQAGLRDGQQVTRTNIYWNDVSKPVQLTVRTEGGSKTIEYYPRGPSLGLIPQYHFNAQASTSARRCVQ